MALLSPAEEAASVSGFRQGLVRMSEREATQGGNEASLKIGGLFAQMVFSQINQSLLPRLLPRPRRQHRHP